MIEKASLDDPRAICALVNCYADKELMLPRSLSDLYAALRDFFVYREGGELLGCAALPVSWEALGEIRSLAVVEKARGRGIGGKLVESCLQEARELGMKRVFVLTYIPEFFRKFGFEPCLKEELPHKIWRDCLGCPKFPHCDEVALIRQV